MVAKFDIRIQHDEHGEFVVLPEEISYGTDVEFILTRVGDVITMRPAPDKSDGGGSEGC